MWGEKMVTPPKTSRSYGMYGEAGGARHYAWGRNIILLVLGGVLLGIMWFSLTAGTGQWHTDMVWRQIVQTSTGKNSDPENLGVSQAVPKRVLVTYPGATELLLTLGLEPHIAGTVKPYGTLPEDIRDTYNKLPRVTAPYVPSREEVLALRPDYIMAWSHHFEPNALGNRQQWEQQGVGTYVVPATVRKQRPTIESTVYPFIDDMGALFHVEAKALSYKESLQARVEAVMAKTARRQSRPTVLILQAHGRSLYSLYAPIYVIDDVVRKAGGRNLVTRQMTSVGPERVLAFNPDYIIYVSVSQTETENKSDVEIVAEVQGDVNLQKLRAVRDGHIIVIPFADVNNGNGRIVDALEKISTRFEEDVR